MNKKEFSRIFSNKYGCSYKKGNEIVSVFIDALSDVLVNGEDIVLFGFGTFKYFNTAQRRIYDFGSKTYKQTKSLPKVKFIPSEVFLKKIRGGE